MRTVQAHVLPLPSQLAVASPKPSPYVATTEQAPKPELVGAHLVVGPGRWGVVRKESPGPACPGTGRENPQNPAGITFHHLHQHPESILLLVISLL